MLALQMSLFILKWILGLFTNRLDRHSILLRQWCFNQVSYTTLTNKTKLHKQQTQQNEQNKDTCARIYFVLCKDIHNINSLTLFHSFLQLPHRTTISNDVQKIRCRYMLHTNDTSEGIIR